jgi:hypothetical protein
MTSYTQPFARAVASLVAEHDVTDVLAHFLAEGLRALGGSAAGLLLRSSSGELEVLTATSHRVENLEAYQAQQDTGPCAEAVSTQAYVFESGVDRMAARWPELADHLAAADFGAVQAHPLRWHDEVLGAVNFFYAEPVDEGHDRMVTGQAFADMTTLILLTPQHIAPPDVVARTREALEARTLVEQAKGVLAYQNGVSVDRAYELLMELSGTDGQSLSVAAQHVVRQASRTP